MRLLIVNYEYPPLGGGGGVLSKLLAAELARTDDVTVVTSRAPGLPADAYEDGVRVVRVPVVARNERPRASMASMLSFGPAARRGAARVLAGRRFDLVHTFFAVPSGPAGVAIARRAGVPHVLTVCGADIYDPTRALSPERFAPMRAAVRRVTGASSALVAISTDLADRATALTGRPDIDVVGCAVEERAVPPRERRDDGRTQFVTIARLVKRKALDAVVGAVPDGSHLIVVGDGPELAALREAAAPGRVTFAGPLEDKAKWQALADADAFVLVSHHEAFGIAYLEAMRAGLPVIAGDVGGQTDFLRDAENALLVPAGNGPRIGKAMTTLASDPQLRKRLGEAGRLAAAAYTPAAMAESYRRIYERVL